MDSDKYCYTNHCDNKWVNRCEICDSYTCDEHGKSSYCNRCFKIIQRIDEAKQGEFECYHAKCKEDPINQCRFCDRPFCDLHRNGEHCIRCHESLNELQTKLKESDQWEKDELEKANMLSPDYYKSYLISRNYHGLDEFWNLVKSNTDEN